MSAPNPSAPASPVKPPAWVAWEVTRRCNLNCIHCRSASDMAHEAHTPLDEAAERALLDELAAYGSPVVVLTGGDPLLHPRVMELLAYGTAAGLRMCLATNGTLVSDDTCRALLGAGVRMVALSLDGASAATHDDFRRQPGAFAATLGAAARLRAHGIPFLVNSSFTRRNAAEIPAVRELARGLGAVAWYLFLIVPSGRGRDLGGELIEPPEYEAILNWHYEAERDETELLMRPTCAPHYYRIFHTRRAQDGLTHHRKSLLFSTGGGKGCVAGQSIALVTANGDVLPCSYFLRAAGSLHDQTFRDIWETAPLLQALRDPAQLQGRCGGCEFNHVCGGCRVRADAAYGDPLAEDPVCAYLPRGWRAPTAPADTDRAPREDCPR